MKGREGDWCPHMTCLHDAPEYFDRSTLLMDRLNASNVEKLTVFNGRPFQMFMIRSEKNSDLALQ